MYWQAKFELGADQKLIGHILITVPILSTTEQWATFKPITQYYLEYFK